MPRLIFILLILAPILGFADDGWRTFTDIKGRSLEAKAIKVEADTAIVELKANRRRVPIQLKQLSAEDVEYLINFNETVEPATGTLYPLTKEDIREGIREIEARPCPSGISKDVHDATQLLNIYRFLCGVPPNVTADPEFSKRAADAAMASKRNGTPAHTLGHSTESCNITTVGDLKTSVSTYIDDAGANNRDARGHRAWCLNPPMGKVGFGSAGDSYSAMWCMDSSGKSIKGPWAYPGMGLFPLKYLHGNAWSLYGAGQADPAKLKVEIFRLQKRPAKAFSSNEKIPGREIAVNHVSLGMNCINFEPAEPAKRGIYWVSVSGGNVRQSYLVELY